jgi:hypothetical protein
MTLLKRAAFGRRTFAAVPGQPKNAPRQAPRNPGRIKKSPLVKAGLKLFSWRRIVETGEIMLQRDIYV